MTEILVTGATGNIGRHVVAELTGAPTRTFRSWVREHVAVFR
ncbi:hypothetical protein ACFXO2_38650 [Streptomyces sp. NPDC059152]